MRESGEFCCAQRPLTDISSLCGSPGAPPDFSLSCICYPKEPFASLFNLKAHIKREEVNATKPPRQGYPPHVPHGRVPLPDGATLPFGYVPPRDGGGGAAGQTLLAVASARFACEGAASAQPEKKV